MGREEKLTFSTNLFHHSLLAPTRTAFSDYTGPDLLCSLVFHFQLFFILFFLFWVCGRLTASFRAHVNIVSLLTYLLTQGGEGYGPQLQFLQVRQRPPVFLLAHWIVDCALPRTHLVCALNEPLKMCEFYSVSRSLTRARHTQSTRANFICC